jgi:hypothetical protein
MRTHYRRAHSEEAEEDEEGAGGRGGGAKHEEEEEEEEEEMEPGDSTSVECVFSITALRSLPKGGRRN